MQLTAEDHDKLQTKQLANVIRKLNAGKTLTAREEALLAKARTDGAANLHPSGNAAPASGYAATWDELGAALNVTRKAIQEWRRDPRYKAHCPRDRADGRKEVAAWLRFMVQHGLKRADQHVRIEQDDEDGTDRAGEIIQPPRVGGSQAQWNVAIAALDHRKKENVVATMEGTLLVAAELEMILGATFAAIQGKLSQFPARVAKFVVGLRDIGEVEERLREEVDADLSDLHAASFTAADYIPALVQELFPERTEEFRGELARSVDALLRAIGRRAVTRETVIEAAAPEPAAAVASGTVVASAGSPPSAPAAVPKRTVANSQSPRGGEAAAKKKRRSRRQTTPPPAEIEAAIVNQRAPKQKRRR